jgi:hypothetical protein
MKDSLEHIAISNTLALGPTSSSPSPVDDRRAELPIIKTSQFGPTMYVPPLMEEKTESEP